MEWKCADTSFTQRVWASSNYELFRDYFKKALQGGRTLAVLCRKPCHTKSREQWRHRKIYHKMGRLYSLHLPTVLLITLCYIAAATDAWRRNIQVEAASKTIVQPIIAPVSRSVFPHVPWLWMALYTPSAI
jgi:hypothetical protein